MKPKIGRIEAHHTGNPWTSLEVKRSQSVKPLLLAASLVYSRVCICGKKMLEEWLFLYTPSNRWYAGRGITIFLKLACSSCMYSPSMARTAYAASLETVVHLLGCSFCSSDALLWLNYSQKWRISLMSLNLVFLNTMNCCFQIMQQCSFCCIRLTFILFFHNKIIWAH